MPNSGKSVSSLQNNGNNVSYIPGTGATSANNSDGGGAADFSSLQTGYLILGRFEIRKQIGLGGMGAVYRAYDGNQDDDIAIKVMLPGLASDEAARQRFMNEARISIKLAHQNIVNTFDVLYDGAFMFITMELLEGKSLRQDMDDRRKLRRPYSEEEALAIARPLCDALEYAHEYTVHRDVKPENVWLTNRGKVKLMDFGIARTLVGSQVGRSTSVLGTAYYMAPEQLVASKEVDPRADQYALGVMLYELLTGQVPTGRSKAVKELRDDVNPSISDAIDRALEPNPDDRFPDVQMFGAALDGAKQVTRKSIQKNVSKGAGGERLTLMGWIEKNQVLVGVGCLLWSGVLIASYMVRQDEKKENQTRWEKWQIEMNATFGQTEKNKGDADTRSKAWAQYLSNYTKDNPFSLEDEKLRAKAETNRLAAELEDEKLRAKAETNRLAAEEEKKSKLALSQAKQQGAARQQGYPQQQGYAPQAPQAPQQTGRTAEQDAGLMILNRMLR